MKFEILKFIWIALFVTDFNSLYAWDTVRINSHEINFLIDFFLSLNLLLFLLSFLYEY